MKTLTSACGIVGLLVVAVLVLGVGACGCGSVKNINDVVAKDSARRVAESVAAYENDLGDWPSTMKELEIEHVSHSVGDGVTFTVSENGPVDATVHVLVTKPVRLHFDQDLARDIDGWKVITPPRMSGVGSRLRRGLSYVSI